MLVDQQQKWDPASIPVRIGRNQEEEKKEQERRDSLGNPGGNQHEPRELYGSPSPDPAETFERREVAAV